MATQLFPTLATTDALGLTIFTNLVNRTDALRARFSGSSEPSSPVAYQAWADTTTGMMKIRNAANTAWVEVGPLGFLPKCSVPWQSAGAVGAKELQFAVPHDATIVRAVLVPDTTTTGSVASTTEWTWMVRNVTQALDLFSATPSTATSVGGVGGGEMTLDAAYNLVADQNQDVAAGDVLRFTIGVNGSPTAVPDCSILLEFTPRGA